MCTCFNNDQTLFDMEGAPVSEVVVIEQTLRLPRGIILIVTIRSAYINYKVITRQ